MKKALAGFFVFTAYLQSDGVVAAQRDCKATEVAVASECVELHAHPHHPEASDEDGENDKIMKDAKERAPDAVHHEGEDVKSIIDGVVRDAVRDAVKRR
jgi:hypothetical protein